MSEFLPGEVIEIAVNGSFAHVQVTHHHPSYPPVVRVLRGLSRQPWSGPDPAERTKTAFKVLIPLKAALARAGCPAKSLGQAPVPKVDRVFPTFRTPVRGRDGAVLYGWFWNGHTLRHGDDSEAATKFPLREVTGAAALLDRIAREA
ncbi:hypothetical protein [Sedimentitalea todarodis]|uniref:Uncharacterized protein n=1 Tax=Sedimentitalea todarodis TaxID=1631240 RepID=A0ABU3VHG6_9RHOB|nr:hypothetical protein [Sedimentitalea todarodis]MDU9005629.1 hypothetical protein [Sedimentitalea todarodis]